MQEQERLLVAAVCAAPDADEPRQVYADWLHQRDEPRGELVTLQLAIAAGRGTPEIAAREAELRAQHEERLLAELGLAPGEGTFVRGFVETVGLVETSVQRLMSVIPCVANAGPLRTLSFRGVDGANGWLSSFALATLLEAPGLAQLSTLELKHCQLDDAAIEQLVHASPHGLTALALDDNPLEDDAVEILARAPLAQRLQVFSYERCGLAARGVDAIATGFTQLVALDISETGLHASFLEGLGKVSPTLQALVIRRNALGGDFLALLTRWSHLSLLHLGLAGNIVDEGYHSLRARHLASLCHLDLNENTNDDSGIADLVQHTESMRLAKLGLAANYIQERGANALSTAPQLADIDELDVRNNRFSEAACAQLIARFGARVLVEPQRGRDRD